MRRFFHTVDAMLRLSFGSEREAGEAASRINAIHDRVRGRLVHAGGAFAAGTPYSAHDPALLAWVHATLVDMNVRVYELLLAPLREGEKDRYCAEAADAIEHHLRLPSGRLPRTSAALEAYMTGMLSGGVIAVTERARTLAREVVFPPAPFVAWPGLALMRLVAVGLLAPAIREGYGFRWSPSRQRALNVSARTLRVLLALTPRLVRHWPAARRTARLYHRRQRP